MKRSGIQKFFGSGALLGVMAMLAFGISPAGAKEPQPKTPRVVAKDYRAAVVFKGTPLRGSNGMNFDAAGRLLVTHVMSSRVSRINIDTGEIETLVDHDRGLRGADDITTDNNGAIFTSNMAGVGGESVFRIDPDGSVTAIYSGIVATNGIQFNRRTGRLFVDQAFVGGGIYELDPKGLKPPRLVSSEFPMAKSMDFDLDNNLLVVVPGSKPGVAVIDPDTGKSSSLGLELPRVGAVKMGPKGEIFMTGGSGAYKITADRKQVITLYSDKSTHFDNLAVSAEGRLFASSGFHATVYEIATDGSGKILRTFSPHGLPNVSSLAARGNDLYVSDTHVLHQVDLKTGTLTHLVGLGTGKGSGSSGFLVGYAHAGPNNLMYAINTVGYAASEQASLPVYSINPDTLEIKNVNRSPRQGLHFPTAIYTSAADEFVYATEFLRGQIEAVPVNDDQLKRRTVAKNLSGPNGIVKKDGKLYIAESLGQRISVVDLSTGRQDVLRSAGVGRPSAIDLHKDGDLLVLDSEGRRLLKINTVNAQVSVIAENLPIYPNVFSNWPLVQVPNGLAVTDDGAIYVGGNDDGSIWKFTSTAKR
jgi:sugar lactone lactonase YvrE